MLHSSHTRQTNATVLCVATLASCILLMSGCTKAKDSDTGTDLQSKYFGYSTTRDCAVEIDYGLSNYQVLFEIYDKNPLTIDLNGAVKTEEEPLYRAATDKNGKFAGSVSLPADLEEIYLYSDYPGTVSPIKLAVAENGAIGFNQKQLQNRTASPQSKAFTGTVHSYPARYKVLGGWDNTGRPDYLLPPANLDTQTLYNLQNVFSLWGGQHIKDFPLQNELIQDNVNISLNIVKPTTIKLVFIKTTASMDNVFGYYTYPTGREPKSVDEIRPVIAFPHISIRNCNIDSPQAIFTGDQIQLKYWNEEKQAFEDTFPAGVSIGWILDSYSFDTANGNVKDDNSPVYYMNRALNTNNMHRSIAMKDDVSGRMLAVGFEDSGITEAGVGNYCDAVFFLDYGDSSAAESDGTGTMPDVPGVPEDANYHVVSGTLAFEDLWPSQGDYDMNDVVVTYKSTVYKNIIANRITKVIDEFTLAHIGGTLACGFGYQNDKLEKETVKNINIVSSKNTAPSFFMQGQMIEPGQSKPNVILFDDSRQAAGTTYTVTTEFTYPVVADKIQPPYNPYLIIRSDLGRGRELHLPKYLPTDLCDRTGFGKGADVSDPQVGLYYISKDNFPFAINIPVINFKYPDEKVRIDKAYPKFPEWVTSNGMRFKDWYKK